MGAIIKNNLLTPQLDKDLISLIEEKVSTNEITWFLLGGERFMVKKPVSGFDFLVASEKGIHKFAIENLANVMHVPMKDMASLLNISYKILVKKKDNYVFNNLISSLSVEIANTIAKGLSTFEDPEKLNRWLHKENKSLNLQKPFDLLNTPTGIKLVNQILGRIEDGVYS
ncbi:antitoxin Xre/MbcA/ParS toxin-binding domain-containing protein [Dyadobacter sp. CY356]|uniref:antitoxin Xre/MbcA/ParS toxin-binding domain-containing protein n=1 Tax=Dyadobacter sp. CY356 TaxID=2906442 RepID=UPI001F268379|nr:antitoxin Xre/MbcA/ParS toxin-binding domain-containing protein [Dyadobacter sp. CY356]MCF0056159.1 MbcA/ParS/Xre antitoxin family protein [Dyadobacter sp. CY356]